MLRRKLILHLAPLVALLLATGIVAVALLQGILTDLSNPSPADPAAHLREQAVHLRWLVLGLSVAFLVVLNVSVITLLNIAGIILRPIDKLIAGTRQLAAGRFDSRVDVAPGDEFAELATAYNRLAEQLQTNERQRMETMGQVGLALNHELNNCIAIIDLQLVLLTRQASGSPGVEKCLRQITASLKRMTSAVESLKHVRRIVLTDYLPGGQKMLDIERSTCNEDDAPEPETHSQGAPDDNSLSRAPAAAAL